MSSFEFQTPGTILSGAGSVRRIAGTQALRSARRTLLVTDRTLVDLGLAGRVEQALREGGGEVVTFADVEPEPSAETVRSAAAAGRDGGVDAVVGLGGGSPMDVAKLAALLAACPQPVEDMYGVDRAEGRRLPLVLIPTTAGTGSEATKVAVVTGDDGQKSPILAPQLVCDTVILDVELTLGLPPAITAATGVDAMVHAIEAYTSAVRKNPVSDQLALQALRLLSGSIRTAVAHGEQVEPRSRMLTGSMLAGLAFVNATVGAVHALAYPIGTRLHVSHGDSIALVLVPVMRFNMPEATPLYAEITRVVVPELHRGEDQEGADRLVAALESLIPEVGLQGRLHEAGVQDGDVPDLVAGALRQERLLSYNIKPMTPGDVEAVYRASL
jgi:alcohol dehydrogenase class IV